MKKLMVLILVLVFSVITLNTLNAATTKINNLGQSPFYGWVENSKIAKELVSERIGDIKYALNMSGCSDGLFFALCEQLNQTRFTEKEIMAGTKIIFMLYRSKGFNKVLQNLEWVGNPVKIFSFHIVYQDRVYEFMVPQPCGNISLLKVEDVLKVEAPKSVERLTKTELPKIKSEEPEIIKEIKPEDKPVVKISKPRLTGVFDINGAMVRKCYGKYFPTTRIGLRYRLDSEDRFTLVATAGFAIPLQINQKDEWEPFFITDLTVRSRVYRFLSLGFGAGYSSAARSYKVPAYWESVVNLGVQIKEVTAFFEIRLALSELDNIGKFPTSRMPHKFIFGIRLPIK